MTNEMQVKIPEGYKQTEVGVIPEDWSVFSLSDLTQSQRPISYGIVQTGPYIEGGVRCLRVVDISNGVIKKNNLITTTIKISTSYKRTQLQINDLVIPLRGKVGEVGIVDADLVGANLTRGVALIALESVWSAPYLKQALSNNQSANRLLNSMNGSALQEISIATLRNFKIAVPKLKEQTAIANALSDVDNLIASLEALIAKKSVIKTAAMQQLLTGKTRLPAFANQGGGQGAKQGHQQPASSVSMAETPQIKDSTQTTPRPGYKQTELGEVPEDWEVVDVGDTCDLLTGYPFPSASYSDHGVRLLRGSNVKRGNTDWSEGITQYWPAITPDIKQYELCKGDIVISMDGSLVGRSFAQLAALDLPAVLLQRVARLRSSSVSVDFLKEWVCSKFFTEHCDSVKTVTAIPHISPEDIRSFKFLCPPTVAEQTAIANVLSDMDTELDALQQRLSKTQKIKQGMMQELLTGKTRLV